jgi:Uma2 family endonuclease
MSNLAIAIPFLENGDHLSRIEFERRYTATPRIKKAELIEGNVYMASPLHFESHAEPHALVMGWLTAYWFATPGVRLGDNATVRLDADNEPQPDALLRLPERVGGKSRVSPDDYIEGAPELIVEIAATSASYDLHQKRHVYRRSGVQEYLVWQVYEKRLDWWILTDGEYVPLSPDAQGLFRSPTFPGLVLDVAALLRGNGAKIVEQLQQAIQTPEHRAFVESLQESKS